MGLQPTVHTTTTKMLRSCLAGLAIIWFISVSSDARQLSRKQRSKHSFKAPDSQHCRDGSTRTCMCDDGTLADLTQHPCPVGSRPDVMNGCQCSEGYEDAPVPGRTHGLHKVCTKDGVSVRPNCTCTDPAGTMADWTRHPCMEGHVHNCTCGNQK